MIVSELIAELQKHPADLPVVFSAEAGQVVADVIAVYVGPRREGEPPLVWLDGGV